MYTFAILFAFFLGAVSGADLTICSELEDALDCCTMDNLVSTIAKYSKPLLEDCLELAECERSLCIAGKLGYSTSDGKLDKTKATELIEKDFSSMSDTVDAIKNKCINGDVTVYGLPGQCDMEKYDTCMRVQVLGRCTKWDTEGDCAGVKQVAEECFKKFA